MHAQRLRRLTAHAQVDVRAPRPQHRRGQQLQRARPGAAHHRTSLGRRQFAHASEAEVKAEVGLFHRPKLPPRVHPQVAHRRRARRVQLREVGATTANHAGNRQTDADHPAVKKTKSATEFNGSQVADQRLRRADCRILQAQRHPRIAKTQPTGRIQMSRHQRRLGQQAVIRPHARPPRLDVPGWRRQRLTQRGYGRKRCQQRTEFQQKSHDHDLFHCGITAAGT